MYHKDKVENINTQKKRWKQEYEGNYQLKVSP
jgi:hypothetical protein